MKFRNLSLISLSAVLCGLVCSQPVWSANYDDYDDIYFDAKKAKEQAEKKAKEDAQKRASQIAASSYVPNVVVDYDDPALVVINNPGLNVDIDEYNRRGQFLVTDTVAAANDSVSADTYAYTRRIERFYNGDVVNGSGNQELIDSYYNTAGNTDINVYVVNPSPWGYYNGWYNPWSPWAWNSLYWNNYFYGPSWSIGFGFYDPWYSWSWGWGPSYGWGPSWGWGGPAWGPPPPGPHPGWHPGPGPGGNWAVNSPGASRPHPSTSGASSTIGRRPGAFSAGANTTFTRPASASRPASNVSAGQSRPSSLPSQTVNGSTPSRGRNNGYNNSTVNSAPQRNPSTQPSTIRNNSGSNFGGRSTHGTTGGGSRMGGGTTGGGGRGRR